MAGVNRVYDLWRDVGTFLQPAPPRVCLNHSAAAERAAVPTVVRLSPTLNNNGSILFPRQASEDSKINYLGQRPCASVQIIRVNSDQGKNGTMFAITAAPRVEELKLDEGTINEPLGSPLPPSGLNIYNPRQNPAIESDVPQTRGDNGNNNAPPHQLTY